MIKSHGLGTIPENKNVVALDTQTPQQWLLSRYPQQGHNCFMYALHCVFGTARLTAVDHRIMNTYPGPTEGHAWVVDNPEPYSRVVLKDIGFFAPELPPKEALFNFIPVSEAEAAPADEGAAARFEPGDYFIRKHGNGPYVAVDTRGQDPWQVILLPPGTKAPKVSTS